MNVDAVMRMTDKEAMATLLDLACRDVEPVRHCEVCGERDYRWSAYFGQWLCSICWRGGTRADGAGPAR